MANAHVHPLVAETLNRWRALPLRCELCGGSIDSGTATVLSGSIMHRGCAVTAAAGIAASVLDGDDSETLHDVQQAAGILAEAARVLASRCGGRA